MVHAGPEERQADRNVHAGVEAHELYRDVPLVVVLDHDDVELAAPRAHQDRVGGPGARRVHPLLHGGGHGRGYLFGVLGPEEPVLPRVGVEACDGDPWPVVAELSQGFFGEADDRKLALGPGPLYGLAQRDVGRDVNDLKLVGDEHHRVVLGARKLGQDLGVPRIFVPREVHGLFVEGSCSYGGNAAGARELGRPLDVAEGGVAGAGVQLTERQVFREICLRENVDRAGLEPRVLGLGHGVRLQRQPEQPYSPLQDPSVADYEGAVLAPEVGVGEGAGDYLGPDAGRVSHRDGYEGWRHGSCSSPLSTSDLTTPTSVSGPPKPPALVTTL